jgi:hypothetical protein
VYYKPDWAAAQKRLEAFWAGEVLDRCPVAVLAPRNRRAKTLEPAGPADIEAYYRREIARLESTYFGGEAAPVARAGACVIERCAGRYFVGNPEVSGAGDALARTRGAHRLCIDLLEQPETVRSAIAALTGEWIQQHEEFYRQVRGANQGAGVIAWLALWAPGRHALLACDFSAIISPHAFREFFLPEIDRETEWCEYATYHLDGPQAMKAHLPTLLAHRGIHVIQFSPGYAPALSPQFIPRYKEIQASGKRLYLPVRPGEIEPLLAELSPRGLFLSTQAGSEAEANALLERATRCCAARNVFPVS